LSFIANLLYQVYVLISGWMTRHPEVGMFGVNLTRNALRFLLAPVLRIPRFAEESPLLNLCAIPPGDELQGTLVGGAGVYWLAVRYDHVVERKLKQRAQRRQSSLFMPRGRPDA
jgi:hypothetical protein